MLALEMEQLFETWEIVNKSFFICYPDAYFFVYEYVAIILNPITYVNTMEDYDHVLKNFLKLFN